MNSLKLKAKMVEKETDIKSIASALNVVYNTARNKINGNYPFTIEEAKIIKAMLDLSDSETVNIFLN